MTDEERARTLEAVIRQHSAFPVPGITDAILSALRAAREEEQTKIEVLRNALHLIAEPLNWGGIGFNKACDIIEQMQLDARSALAATQEGQPEGETNAV